MNEGAVTVGVVALHKKWAGWLVGSAWCEVLGVLRLGIAMGKCNDSWAPC